MKPTFHVTIASDGRRTIAEEPESLRLVVRALAAPSAGEVVLFGAVDDHAHSIVETELPFIFARDQARVLKSAVPGLVLQRPHVKPVESRKHYERLVGYVLEQPRKHGLATPPALWEGSCFLDLVGARLLPGFDRTRVARALPRLRLRQLLKHVGLEATPIECAGDDALRRLAPARIVELCAVVYGLSSLAGRRPEQTSARTLAAQACGLVGYSSASLREALRISSRTARRLQARPVASTALRALRKLIALHDRTEVRGRGAG